MDKIIFFATLIVFPFGQLFKIGQVNIFDALIVLLAIVTLLQKPKFPNWYKYFFYFILVCLFSLLFNYQLFELKSVLYLIRLASYSLVAVFIYNHLNDKDKLFKQLLGGVEIEIKLIWLSLASAVFGWLQYLIWPDLTFLKYLGWDDHLLRMVGTFLDPTYLGLILVLGVILALKNKMYLAVMFLSLSVLFTYSRSSYLILFVVFLFDYVKNNEILLLRSKKFLLLNSLFLIIFLLPKNIGEGTTLTRTVSGNSKLINYIETIEIIKKSPVLGVGFNNICKAREVYLGDTNTESHGCNGADSSILFLIAITGVVGLILFGNFIIKIPASHTLVASLTVVLIHSLFVNSLFYPHIMFWLFALFGLETKGDSQRS